MHKNMQVEIASPPDREKLVVQIMIGNEQWAEINQESIDLCLEIYPRQDGKPWILKLDDAMNALIESRQKLRG